VLNNINRHIKEKLDSNWFTSLQQSLYKPIEKESRSYNKSINPPTQLSSLSSSSMSRLANSKSRYQQIISTTASTTVPSSRASKN
jgi:hypothetical protein